jgi:FAD/FMN-containing dehydrogenase
MGVYVNYEFGNEGLGSVYGEEWRLEKLRALKRQYDPKDRFGGHMQIR